MTTDPIAEMLTIIRNGYLASLTVVTCSRSKIKVNLIDLLAKLNFVKSFKVEDKLIKIELLYENKLPAVTKIKRISRPGLRIYQDVNKLKKTKSRLTTKIVSTSKGLVTDKEAIAKKLGGEIVASIY